MRHDEHDEHDMDEATCPDCGGPTICGMVTAYGKCARCIRVARTVRRRRARAD